MKGKLFLVVAIVSAICLFSVVSHAANVVYIHAGGGNVNYLSGYGHSVNYKSNPIGMILGDLAGYDVAIVASNSVFSEPTNIGNVLKQFADGGHGVVLTEFVFQGGWALSGGIMGHGYSPFTVDPSSYNYGITSAIGTVYAPSSPLLSGVVLSNLMTDYQADAGLDAGASLIADWTSGRHAIAYNSLGGSSVVGLNLFPDSSYMNGDDQRLVANAVTFSLTGGAAVPAPMTLLLLAPGLAGLAAIRRRIGK